MTYPETARAQKPPAPQAAISDHTIQIGRASCRERV